MDQQNNIQTIESDYKIEIGIKDGKVVSLHWGQLVDNEKHLSNAQVIDRITECLTEALKYHLNKKGITAPASPEIAEDRYKEGLKRAVEICQREWKELMVNGAVIDLNSSEPLDRIISMRELFSFINDLMKIRAIEIQQEMEKL